MIKFIKQLFSKTDLSDESIYGYLLFIQRWLEQYAMPLAPLLNHSASDDDLMQVESELGVVFPKQLKEAYKIHNGERSDSDGVFGLWRWLSLEDLTVEFHNLAEHDDPGSKRIPILVSGGGDIMFVESGEYSEVFEWWHEGPERDVKYADFGTFLKCFTMTLNSGGYAYLPGELMGLVDTSEL